MSDFVVKFLGQKIGERSARLLVDSGLLDSGRFQCRTPLTRSVVEVLANLPSLKVFQFADIKPDVRTLTILNEVLFANRKDVTLRVFGHDDRWANINILNDLPEVERFDWDVDVFGSLAPLYRLKKLVHVGLGFTQPKPKVSIGFVEDFAPSLESLSLAGDFRDILTTVPNLGRLEAIWFVSTKLDGFDFLDGLPIEIFGNYGGRVQSFDSLRKLKMLRHLWIKTNPKIENLDFLEELTNLERIELLYLAKVDRFPKCDHLKKLGLVFAFECNRLSDISELEKLSGPQMWVTGKALRGRELKTEGFSIAEAVDWGGRSL